jgi:hypothetical protein
MPARRIARNTARLLRLTVKPRAAASFAAVLAA